MNSRTPRPKQQQQVVIVAAAGQAIWYHRGLRTFLGPTLVLLQVLEAPIFYRSGRRTEVRSAEAAKRNVRRRDRNGRSYELRSRRGLVALPKKNHFFRSIFQTNPVFERGGAERDAASRQVERECPPLTLTATAGKATTPADGSAREAIGAGLARFCCSVLLLTLGLAFYGQLYSINNMLIVTS